MDRIEQFMSTLVPPGIVHDLANDGEEVASQKAVSRSFDAAILFIDISDFTSITEKFEKLGPDGVEQLTDALNRHFGSMISSVVASGGEIDNLPGDALFAYWHIAKGADRRAVLREALLCANNIQERFKELQLDDGTKLNVHSALAAGPLRRLYLGGHLDHRLNLLSGEPLDRISALSDAAGPGELLIDENAGKILQGDYSGEQLPGIGQRFVALSEDLSAKKTSTESSSSELDLKNRAAPFVHHFLQNGLRQRIQADQLDWLAELRHLTVTFVALEGLELGADADLGEVQKIALAMQSAVHEFGGAVQSFNHDDKGIIFFAAFGLPQLSTGDDAVRAIAAMQSIAGQLKEFGYRSSIGICSGMTYCGILGTDDWHCYSVRGTVTNRAARLMSIKSNRIIVDATTRRAAEGRVSFKDEQTITLKGIDKPVQISTVDGAPVETDLSRGEKILVGRETELATIEHELGQFTDDKSPRIVMVDGAAGVGKSSLLDEAARFAEEKGIRVLRGRVDALDAGAVYAAWRGVFQGLFGLGLKDTLETKHTKITAHIPDDQTWFDRIPLLATVLQIPLLDSALTRQMDAITRADNTTAIMCHVIDVAAADQPILIVLDDCQWMDTASWNLILELAQSGKNIMFMLGIRSEREAGDAHVEKLMASQYATDIVLDDLDYDSISILVRRILDVDEVPEALVDFIFTRGSGNPYFTHELVQALREQGHIEIIDKKCVLSDKTGDLDAISFPDTIERVIVSRVDRLEPNQQLTLKVASVIGQRFSVDALLGVHPMAPEEAVCQDHLESIEARDFTTQVPDSPQQAYLFRHVMTHQTVYGLLAFSSRRELHQAIGIWIETNIEQSKLTQKAVLAHHWTMADRPELALDYLEAAGNEALNSGAYAEAAAYFDRAISALRKRSEKPDSVREARMFFGLGEIYTRLGDVDKSYNNFCNGLETLGIVWPKNTFQLVIAVFKAVVRQAWHRIRKLKPDIEQPVNQRELVLANGLEKFGYLFFFEQRLNDLVLTTLQGLNLSEQANSPADIRKTFAQMSVSLSIAKLHKWADYYARNVELLPLKGSTDNDLAFQYNYLSMFAIGQGKFADAERFLRDGLELAKKIGNKRLILDLTAFSRSSPFLQGNYAESEKTNEAYRTAVLASDDKQHQYFMRIALGGFALRMSQFEEANRLLREASEKLLPGYLMDKLHVTSLLAVSEHRAGNKDAGWRLANEALECIRSTPPIGYYAMDAYEEIAALFMDYLEIGDVDIARKELFRKAGTALKGFDGFSKSFTVSRPQYLILRGRLELLNGNENKALTSTRQGLEGALNTGLRYEVAMANLQLGRMTSLGLEAQKSHISEAVRQFEVMGLVHKVDIAKKALSELG